MRSIVLIASLCLTHCLPHDPRTVENVGSPNLEPFLKAMAASDRIKLGFSDLPKRGTVTVEHATGQPYDVMLHYYDTVNRCVGFRRTNSDYTWISEQELHTGPQKWIPDESEINEYLVIEFQTEPVNGIPLNQLYIRYHGPDGILSRRDDITLDRAREMIRKWNTP